MNSAYFTKSSSSASKIIGMRKHVLQQILRSDRQHRRFSTRSTTGNNSIAQQKRPPRNEASNFSAARPLLNPKKIHSVAMEECGGSTASKPPFRQMKPQSEIVDLPSTDQLKTLFFASAAPMVGFGFMDNFIMIQAGGLIDSTLGVKFGLATLTAAAMGQICSDVRCVRYCNWFLLRTRAFLQLFWYYLSGISYHFFFVISHSLLFQWCCVWWSCRKSPKSNRFQPSKFVTSAKKTSLMPECKYGWSCNWSDMRLSVRCIDTYVYGFGVW